MDSLETIVPLLGLCLCLLALLQVAHWSTQTLEYLTQSRRAFSDRRKQLKRELTAHSSIPGCTGEGRTWRGYRSFRVKRIHRETINAVSVFLAPEDGKPIPPFRPGQYLTVRLEIPGIHDPVVRCYSISELSVAKPYCITVKKTEYLKADGSTGFGRASSWMNQGLKIGDRIELKSPSGNFCLDEDSDRPIVFLAAGIGITPIITMLERLAESSNRDALLVYGVKNSDEHAFAGRISRLIETSETIRAITCYSEPKTFDRRGSDYDHHVPISVELLKDAGASPDSDFYLCGPPGFMRALNDGLRQWGVEPGRIRTEAFGPASLNSPSDIVASEKPGSGSIATQASQPPSATVRFVRSEVAAAWSRHYTNLLECAEELEIPIDSGCRSGSCGTCATRLISGNVHYPAGFQPQCQPGECLVCIARPDGSVELEA